MGTPHSDPDNSIHIMNTITPKNSDLKLILDSIKKRSKAIKHKGGVLTCERVIDRSVDIDLEKLEFSLFRKRSTKSPYIRLHAWSDRWVWLDARESSKNGWIWEWTTDGRFIGTDIGKSIAQAFETSINTTFKKDQNIPLLLGAIWSKILASGLSVVK